ncbi:MAG TPA: hypothetical protein DDW52_13990 [Planctomycetaceae bacterium]|nr:hypothetical protein [Planctomycetaceae bacterium]
MRCFCSKFAPLLQANIQFSAYATRWKILSVDVRDSTGLFRIALVAGHKANTYTIEGLFAWFGRQQKSLVPPLKRLVALSSLSHTN